MQKKKDLLQIIGHNNGENDLLGINKLKLKNELRGRRLRVSSTRSDLRQQLGAVLAVEYVENDEDIGADNGEATADEEADI